MLKTKTYKYRLYPTKNQAQKLEWTLSMCRMLYNSCLLDRRNHYAQTGQGLSRIKQQQILKADKERVKSLREIHSQVLQDVLFRVDKAYKNFFKRLEAKNGKAGYPRLKGEGRYDSITYPQPPGFQLTQNGLKLSKIGTIRLKQHRPIVLNGKIKTCTIKRDLDRWYACFSVEIPEKPKLQQPKTAIGIDVGLNSFAVLSDGATVDNPRPLKGSEKRLIFLQKRHSKKAKGSKNRRKHQLKVAKLHRKVREQRQDFQHKLSRQLVCDYDLIAIEKLNIKGMVCNHHLAKSISDAAWGQFLRFIIYKAAEAGKWCIEVVPNGTTQVCFRCKSIVSKDLSVRIHLCSGCGLRLSRDHNAALNILFKALDSIGLIGLKAQFELMIDNGCVGVQNYTTATVGTTESHAWGGKGLLFPENQEASTFRLSLSKP